ncbi:MAG: 3'(2'),5'-bisphosphate nucleotidase CysQ [Pseudomonadota bacterium]
MTNYLPLMEAAARSAGAAILEVYAEDDFGVETKGDDSPLTRADLAAHRIILAALEAGASDVPVLSEESTDVTYEERSTWEKYFLVDPLDGTKEFINRNGEFTVNIAYIEFGVPVQGVVYVPVKDVLYEGDQLNSTGARVTRDGQSEPIKARVLESTSSLTIVASRRHGGDALEKCLEVLRQHFDEIDTTNMGSSLKLCLVAEGKADLYPRLAPTSEWDTAAAQAVVEAAGGQVVDVSLNTLRYNAKEDILNPFFYVISDPSFDWKRVLSQVEIG